MFVMAVVWPPVIISDAIRRMHVCRLISDQNKLRWLTLRSNCTVILILPILPLVN